MYTCSDGISSPHSCSEGSSFFPFRRFSRSATSTWLPSPLPSTDTAQAAYLIPSPQSLLFPPFFSLQFNIRRRKFGIPLAVVTTTGAADNVWSEAQEGLVQLLHHHCQILLLCASRFHGLPRPNNNSLLISRQAAELEPCVSASVNYNYQKKESTKKVETKSTHLFTGHLLNSPSATPTLRLPVFCQFRIQNTCVGYRIKNA